MMKKILSSAKLSLEKSRKSNHIFLYRPSDYIEGTITKGGKAISKYDGSYCGFLNFDGTRYWDGA